MPARGSHGAAARGAGSGSGHGRPRGSERSAHFRNNRGTFVQCLRAREAEGTETWARTTYSSRQSRAGVREWKGTRAAKLRKSGLLVGGGFSGSQAPTWGEVTRDDGDAAAWKRTWPCRKLIGWQYGHAIVPWTNPQGEEDTLSESCGECNTSVLLDPSCCKSQGWAHVSGRKRPREGGRRRERHPWRRSRLV